MRWNRWTRTGRTFVETCEQIRVKPEFARLATYWPDGGCTISVTVTGAGYSRVVPIVLVPSPQHFGGRRWWWQCPACSRRCQVLLSPSAGDQFACRKCWKAVYMTDYGGRRWFLGLGQTLGSLPGGSFAAGDEAKRLLAPRRRGVRRGRRLHQRALRLLDKGIASAGGLESAISSYWSGQGRRRG
jgi:hypothetical protein